MHLVRESRSKPVTSLLKMCFLVAPKIKAQEKASTEGVEKIMGKELSKRRCDDMSMKRVMRAYCTEKSGNNRLGEKRFSSHGFK